ncbi:MAG: ferritin family protein [Christensenellales bacterium]|nr:ferritin family protein [Christensenellales bacterium]
MQHMFNDAEGLRIAVEMERRGERFYRRAAKISRAQDAVALLNQLADDEVYHAREFQRLYELEMERRGDAPEDAYDDETNAYLTAMAADVVFPGGLMALRKTGFDDVRAVLTTAIASEKDSILFYTELARLAGDGSAAEIFREIARQERGHLARLLNKLADLDEE